MLIDKIKESRMAQILILKALTLIFVVGNTYILHKIK